MVIHPLIKFDYPTVHAFQGANQIRKMISNHGSALVLSEEAVAMGVITAHDLASRPHNLVIDCLTDKPVISKNHLIPDVLALMQEAHSDLLMVCENGELVGVIHKNDITDFLCRSVTRQTDRVHSIAHDLKSPLSSVLGATYLLEHSDCIDPDNREIISIVQEACRYATNMINSLLVKADISTIPSHNEATDLGALLHDCAHSFCIATQQKGLQMNLRVPNEPCFVDADGIELKRAISNILSNAIKFTPHGGAITVETTQRMSDVLITIQDNGIGIPPELQTCLFEKFTQAKRTGTNGEASTGLGMHITRQIIENQGGNIWIESVDKQGTTVYIQLKATHQHH